MRAPLRDPANSGLYQGISFEPWVTKGDEAPFILIDTSGPEPAISGQEAGFAGHRLWLADNARPRGIYAQWSWDGECLTAQTDPLGYFSLFVYADKDRIGLSPSILQLIANGASAQPDETALAVFHRIGFFVNQDTPFRNIRTLGPGASLRWRPGKLEIEGGIPPAPPASSLTRDQAIEAFIELPRAAMRSFLASWDGPIAMPLSGGRDSRHALLEMLHQGRRPETCLTFHHGGRAYNGEVKAARAITERAGVHHSILGKPRPRLRDTLRALLITQLCGDEHAQMMPLRDYLDGRGCASIDGIGGDILTNPDDMAADFMRMSKLGDYTGIARRLGEGHTNVIARQYGNGGAGAQYSPARDDAAIDRIAAAIRQHENAQDPYQAFWFWHRTRREISFVAAGIMGDADVVFCPYLDPEMVELGLSLPWNITQDQMLHDLAISRAYPDFTDIPYAESFRNDTPSRVRLSRFHNTLDAFRVAARVSPEAPLAAMVDLLRRDKLKRAHADIYRLHAGFIASMDAEQARRLLNLGEELNQAAPKGDEVVSDVFPGS